MKRKQASMGSLSDNPKSAIQNPKWLGLFAIVFALMCCGVRAEAQQLTKVPRIGFLDASTASGIADLLEAFRQEMRKLGWIETKNVIVEYRFAEQRFERLPELAADLVRLNVDLIVVAGTPSALAAKKATTTIPIVITNTGNPVAAGLVASLARPGGNVTGLVSLGPELNTKRLEILKDVVPKLAGVGLLWPAAGGLGADLQLKDLRLAAVALKVRLEEIETQLDLNGIENAFQITKQKQVGVLMTITTRPFFVERKRIVELAGKYRFPAITSKKSLPMRVDSCPTGWNMKTSIGARLFT